MLICIIKCSEKLDLFLLSLAYGSDIKQLVQIKYLLNQTIRFEKVSRNQDLTQCHRCQRFGHSSTNCTMKPRCVKCLKNHLTSECDNLKQIKKASVDIPTGVTTYKLVDVPICINCGKEGHPANYRHCEARLKYIQNIEQRREQNRINDFNRKKFHKQTVNNYYNGTSFANQLKNTPQHTNNDNTHTEQSTSATDFFERECQSMFKDSLSNIINMRI